MNRGEVLRFSGQHSICRHFDAYIPVPTEFEKVEEEDLDWNEFDDFDDEDEEHEPIKRDREINPSDGSIGLWKRMQLTYPPLETLQIRARGHTAATFVPKHLPFAEYVDACANLCKKEDATWVTNVGGEKWKLVLGTVDTITGFEMLKILEGESEESTPTK